MQGRIQDLRKGGAQWYKIGTWAKCLAVHTPKLITMPPNCRNCPLSGSKMLYFDKILNWAELDMFFERTSWRYYKTLKFTDQLPYSRKIWWIGLNQQEKYWWILIWSIAEFDLAMPWIWRLCVCLTLLIEGSGLLQLPLIELKLAAPNEGIIFFRNVWTPVIGERISEIILHWKRNRK